MCEVVKNYFAEVFAGNSSSENVQQSFTERRVSDVQNQQLVTEVTFEEFSLAIKEMHPDKALGLYGLNPAFFQQF